MKYARLLLISLLALTALLIPLLAPSRGRTEPPALSLLPIQDQLGACLAMTNIAWSLSNQTKVWSSFDPDLPDFLQGVTEFMAGGGYFVNTSGNCTINSGANNISLYTGWNLFGWQGESVAPTPTPTPTATATATPTATPGFTFGDGTWLVGTDVPPGIWRNSDSSGGCYWERLSGFGGTLGEIIANDFSSIIQTVDIKPSDKGFTSDRCGTWSQNLQPPSAGPNQPFGSGKWLVGQEIGPGIWRNSDSSDNCYWERLSGFGGTLGEIIANEFDDSIQTVEIESGDAGFTSDRCGTWSKNLIPPSSGPNQPFGPGVWLVGQEVAPGTWRNSDSSDACYWERRSGLSGEFSDIIDNEFSYDIQTVHIAASDVAFYSHRCGTWTRIGN